MSDLALPPLDPRGRSPSLQSSSAEQVRPPLRRGSAQSQGWREIPDHPFGSFRPVASHPLQPSTSRRPSLPVHLGPQPPHRPFRARPPIGVGTVLEESLLPSPPPMPLGFISSAQKPLVAAKNHEPAPTPLSPAGHPAAVQTPLPIDTMMRELARQATWKDSALILLPPILGLGAKITLAIGTRGVMLAEDTRTESGAESAEWFGVMAIGVFALITSIAIGSHDASRINPRAPWLLGGASLLSAAAFALGEFTVIRSAEKKSQDAFYGGSTLVWCGMVLGAMVNATYFFLGESVRGAVPIPHRNTVVMTLGMIAISTMFVFSLNASSQKYGLALRDSVISITWLLAALPFMLAFSEGIRKDMGLVAHRHSGTVGLPLPATNVVSPRTTQPSASYFAAQPGRPS